MNKEKRFEIEIANEFGQKLVDKLKNCQMKPSYIAKGHEPAICRYWESI